MHYPSTVPKDETFERLLQVEHKARSEVKRSVEWHGLYPDLSLIREKKTWLRDWCCTARYYCFAERIVINGLFLGAEDG